MIRKEEEREKAVFAYSIDLLSGNVHIIGISGRGRYSDVVCRR